MPGGALVSAGADDTQAGDLSLEDGSSSYDPDKDSCSLDVEEEPDVKKKPAKKRTPMKQPASWEELPKPDKAKPKPSPKGGTIGATDQDEERS